MALHSTESQRQQAEAVALLHPNLIVARSAIGWLSIGNVRDLETHYEMSRRIDVRSLFGENNADLDLLLEVFEDGENDATDLGEPHSVLTIPASQQRYVLEHSEGVELNPAEQAKILRAAQGGVELFAAYLALDPSTRGLVPRVSDDALVSGEELTEMLEGSGLPMDVFSRLFDEQHPAETFAFYRDTLLRAVVE